jgi:hypothetical protein
MPSRRSALEAFYSSTIWNEHRDAVNETLVDYENVLLLRPATPLQPAPDRESLVTATIWPFAEPVPTEIISLFAREIAPLLTESGATLAAALVTEPSENNFPRLAIREGENVFVWFTRFHNSGGYDAHTAALDRSPLSREFTDAIGKHTNGPPQLLRLAPAARSRLA